MKFLRFVSLRLPERNYSFFIANGNFKPIRMPQSQFVSVKNPFIPELDNGESLTSQ